MIVDPVVEATFNSLSNLTNVSNNPHFEGIITEGFSKEHKFVKNIFGFDIWTSNFLPVKTATEALNASSYNLANDTAEIELLEYEPEFKPKQSRLACQIVLTKQHNGLIATLLKDL